MANDKWVTVPFPNSVTRKWLQLSARKNSNLAVLFLTAMDTRLKNVSSHVSRVCDFFLFIWFPIYHVYKILKNTARRWANISFTMMVYRL